MLCGEVLELVEEGNRIIRFDYATIAVSIICKDFLAENPLIAIFIFVPAVVFALAALVAYVKHYAYLKKEEVNQGGLIDNIRKEQ